MTTAAASHPQSFRLFNPHASSGGTTCMCFSRCMYQLHLACMLNGAWLHGTCTVQPQRGAIQVCGTLCVANGIDSCGWLMPHDSCVHLWHPAVRHERRSQTRAVTPYTKYPDSPSLACMRRVVRNQCCCLTALLHGWGSAEYGGLSPVDGGACSSANRGLEWCNHRAANHCCCCCCTTCDT